MNKPVHGAKVRSNTPSDLQTVAPIPCDFKVGDLVIYTNDAGLTFDREVVGFAPAPTSTGRFIYIDSDCWWFPVAANSLSVRAKALELSTVAA